MPGKAPTEKKGHTVLSVVGGAVTPLNLKWLSHYVVGLLTSYEAQSAKELHLCIYTIHSQLGLLTCNGKKEFCCIKDEDKIIYFAWAVRQLPYPFFWEPSWEPLGTEKGTSFKDPVWWFVPLVPVPGHGPHLWHCQQRVLSLWEVSLDGQTLWLATDASTVGGFLLQQH